MSLGSTSLVTTFPSPGSKTTEMIFFNWHTGSRFFYWITAHLVTSGHTFGRDSNIHDRVSTNTESAFVSSSDQGAVASSPLNLGVFANQILPIPKFSGEVDNGKGDLENFTDWKERSEMTAEAYHWNQHSKLVNLVTRLCGQAYSFYRSCDGRQQSCYVELVEQLIRSFTPVRIGAV